MAKDRKELYAKMVFGAAIAYAVFWILLFLPFRSPHIAFPVAGALAILIVEWIGKKTGFYIL